MAVFVLFIVTLSSLSSASIFGEDNFVKKYTYAKVMTKCFGNISYTNYIRRIKGAERECNQIGHIAYHDTTITRPPFTSTSTSLPPYLESLLTPLEEEEESEQPLYNVWENPVSDDVLFNFVTGNNRRQNPSTAHIFSGVDLRASIGDIRDIIHNFTCLLQRMDIIDANYNINYRTVLNTFIDNNQLEYRLEDDLRDGINYCKEAMNCLPNDGSAMPMEVQRLVSFIECEKRIRLVSCFRHDLRQNLQRFDLATLPNSRGRSNYLVKIMAIVMGTDTLKGLEFF